MKRYNIKTITCAVILGFGLTACSDYLDHPTEDNYDTSTATIIGEVLLI